MKCFFKVYAEEGQGPDHVYEYTRSDQGLHYPVTEILNSEVCLSGQQRPY